MIQVIFCFFISINLLFPMCCSSNVEKLDIKKYEPNVMLSQSDFFRKIQYIIERYERDRREKEIRSETLSLLNNIPAYQYSTHFVNNAQLLCDQCCPLAILAIKSLARILPTNQPAFMEFFFDSMTNRKLNVTSAYFASRLSMIDIQYYEHYKKMFKKMQEWSFFSNCEKAQTKACLIEIEPEVLTLEFIDVVKHITPFFARKEYLRSAIKLVHEKFSKEEYPLLKNTFDNLYKNLSSSNLRYIFYVLEKIPHNELNNYTHVVNIFYSAYGKNKKEIIEVFYKIINDYQGNDIWCFKHCLNIGEPYVKTVLEFSKLIPIDSAIESVAYLHPSNLTQDFVKKVEKIENKYRRSDFIRLFRGLDYRLFTATHIKLFNTLDSLSHNLIKGILKIEDEKITPAFVEIIEKYKDFNDLGSMIDALSYDEIMRIPSLSVTLPDQRELPSFMRFAKYLLLQETPHIELERYRLFYCNYQGYVEILRFTHPNLQVFWVDFCLANPVFIRVIPFNRLQDAVINIITEQQLIASLNRLHIEYAVNNAPRVRPGIAFNIHDFSNQLIMTENSTKKSFNDAVLDHIKKKIIVLSGTFNDVREQLYDVFKTLAEDPLKPITQTTETFTWCMDRILDDEKENFIRVYDYVKAFAGESVPLWLYTFLDESTNAYDVQHGSCIRGINERLITSLRNIPITDKTLQDYFQQAESTYANKAKIKKITDYAFWAAQLKEKGILTTTDKNLARRTFKALLMDFFAPVTPETQNIIDTTMESFDDSNEHANDGIWSKIKKQF